MADENSDLTLRILREMRTEFAAIHATLAEVQTKLAEHDKRFDIIDARFGRVDVELRSLKATVNRHTVLHEATIEMVAQLKAGRTVTDVSIRQHESELEEIRERIARLEEKS